MGPLQRQRGRRTAPLHYSHSRTHPTHDGLILILENSVVFASKKTHRQSSQCRVCATAVVAEILGQYDVEAVYSLFCIV